MAPGLCLASCSRGPWENAEKGKGSGSVRPRMLTRRNRACEKAALVSEKLGSVIARNVSAS